MLKRRAVITGMGLITGIGNTIDEFGDALFAGKSCIGPLSGFEIQDARFRLGGQIKDFDFTREMPDVDAKRIQRYSQFALVSAQRAITDASLRLDAANRDRIGVSFGTAAGSMGETVETEVKRFQARGERGVSPLAWAESTWSACTTHVSIHFGLRGPTSTHTSGCVTGLDTIAWGVTQIREGRADVMVVGGTDTPFFPFTWAMMGRSGILAPAPDDGGNIPRPFSYDHNGIALIEGGSALVIESEAHARLRGARIYAEILGIASVEEACPMTKLDHTGRAFAMAIERTLEDAGLSPRALDWVGAHGTGYSVADCAESRGIETALGDYAFNIPCSSIRGAIGQPFAGGGALYLAAACLAIHRQLIPPTINFSRPAEGCRLDYVPNEARVARVQRALMCSAGVGGTHSGCVVAAYEP